MKTAIHSLADVSEVLAQIESMPNEMDRIARLCDVYLSANGVPPAMLHSDPFGEQHLDACRRFLADLSGNARYDPEQHERSNFLDGFAEGHYTPSIYRYGDSRMVGDSLSAAGAIITAMDVRAGDAILEYGAGDGQIALSLARMGCDVSVIDLDERYLQIIQRQAAALGVKVNTMKGLFGDPVPGKLFDRVLFYEAFHHSLDHTDTLLRVRSVLKPGGRLLLAGEPVMARNSHWRSIVPFAWGPRLDGLSLRAIKTYGWCELGFQREYLVEKLMRSGWLVQFTKCATTDRGDVYAAVIVDGSVDVGHPSYIIESMVDDDGWFDGEGASRWTRGNASLGLDQTQRARALEIALHNFLPIERHVTLSAGDDPVIVEMAPGESKTVTVPLPADYVRLIILCPPLAIAEIAPESTDQRRVGIAISTMRYLHHQ